MKEEKEITIAIDRNVLCLPIFHSLARSRKEEPAAIEYKRVVTEPDGTKKEMSIKVLSAGKYGLLKGTDLKPFAYFLWKWHKAGEPDGEYKIFYTANDYFDTIREIKGKKKDKEKKHREVSAIHYKQFKEQVMRLRLTGIIIKNGYKTKDGHYISFEKPINLLTDAEIFERVKDVKDKQQYFQFSYVVINPIITRAIKEKNIKLLRFDEICKIRSEVALLLYNHLEVVMADKKVYERDIVELAEDVGMTEKEAKFIKRRLLKAIKELEGKELTSGRIKKIEIVKSETASGWKIRVEKGKHIKDSEQQQQIEEREYWLNVYNNLSAEEKAEVDKYVDEQMKRFYELTGRDGGDIYRELVIIEYLKEKGGKK